MSPLENRAPVLRARAHAVRAPPAPQVGGTTCRPWSEKQWELSFAAALSGLPGDSDSPSEGDSESDSDSQAPAPEQPDTAGLGCSSRVGRDGIATTGTAQELALARTLAKDKWGRWGGRDGKMARIAAAEAQHAASAGVAASVAKAGKRSRAQAEAAEAEAADARERAAKRARDEAAAPQAIATASRSAVTAVSSFWWSAVFRFAGALEGALQDRTPPPPAVFAGTEAEQEAMALAAERNKSSGRKGLGRGKRGVEDEWTGTRKTFGEEEEQQAQVEPPVSEAAAAISRLKWKKLASKVLAAAPGGLLSERKLRRATCKAAAAVLGAGCEHQEEALTRAFDQRVLASSKFCRAPCGRLQLAGGDEQGE